MTQLADTPGPVASFEEHPLYLEAMNDLAAGDEATAVAKLKLLAALYPDEPTLQELAVRTELRTAISTSTPIPVEHGQPGRTLRNLVLLFLALVVGLMSIAGFIVTYDLQVRPIREASEQKARLLSLRQRSQQQSDDTADE